MHTTTECPHDDYRDDYSVVSLMFDYDNVNRVLGYTRREAMSLIASYQLMMADPNYLGLTNVTHVLMDTFNFNYGGRDLIGRPSEINGPDYAAMFSDELAEGDGEDQVGMIMNDEHFSELLTATINLYAVLYCGLTDVDEDLGDYLREFISDDLHDVDVVLVGDMLMFPIYTRVSDYDKGNYNDDPYPKISSLYSRNRR